MKIVLPLLLALSLNTQANSQNADLTAKQKDKIRSLVDSICGDTWCEGDYYYEFTSVTNIADSDGYSINFRIRVEESNPWYETSCEFDNRTQYADYVVTRKLNNGKLWEVLNEDFYTEMTECVSERESEASELYPIEPSKSGTKVICNPRNPNCVK